MHKSLQGGVVGAILTIMMVLAGCGGAPSPGAAPSTASPQPAGATASTPSPTPSPTARTAAQDKAELEDALVSVKDLGKPWLRPKSVSVSGTGGEICPGHRSAATKVSTTAQVGVKMTEGAKTGASIGSFNLATLPTADASALRTAYAKDVRTCARYVDASKLYVVRTAEGPTSIDLADEVVAAWAERIYYDKAHTQLAYARHVAVARTGRVVTYVEYAFLITETFDPKAKDFGPVTRLIIVQLKKVAQHPLT